MFLTIVLDVLNSVIFMKQYILLLCIFLLGFSVSDVQKEIVILDWSEGKGLFQDKNNIIEYFDKSGITELGKELPVYTRIYSMNNTSQAFSYSIKNAKFKEFKQELSAELKEKVPQDIELVVKTLKSGNSLKKELLLIPLMNVDGRIYKLTSFEIERTSVAHEKSALTAYNWKNESVLSSGKWIKISTSGKGIYKIPYSKLTEWGFSQPQNVKVYGCGAAILSENPGEIAYDDLEQSATWINSNGGEECLFFFAPGFSHWTPSSAGDFLHKNNDYSRKGFFFLNENSDSSRKPEMLNEVTATASHSTSFFNEYDLLESDLVNILPLGSGKQWFGERFTNATSQRSFSFTLSDVVPGSEASLLVNAAARSYQSSAFEISGEGGTIGELSFTSVNTNDTYGQYADESKRRFTFAPSNGELNLSFTYTMSNQNAEAWLDYIELNYKRQLMVGNSPLFFRDTESVGDGNIVEFSIQNGGEDTRVLEVSHINNLKEVPLKIEGNTISFKEAADELREYVVFNPAGEFKEPELVGDVENQNLHALSTPDFVIISHPDFIQSAEELAVFHRDYDAMDVEVVNVEQVYNEFSSGAKNATGIRNFIKMFYDRGESLKYVLLYGDGSYDNLGIKSGSNNFIPTFQSANSLKATSSFVTDDYFVMLDADESVYDGAIDLGIGRIPASTAFEAELVVDKIKRYYKPEALGDWRNVISFIGDDEDSGLHMRQSEELADTINNKYNEFVTDKTYFDAYVEEVTPAGERYPDVNTAINERVEEGVLILNYIGHANERFLAHEHVLDISDINSWSNKDHLPIFVTATCEFSRFDGDDTSAGEYVLLNPNGGGIGLFSTTRVVYASANFTLSKSFYNYIFANDTNGEHYRMGDVMRLAKTNIGSSINKRNFSLLADPALKLSYPKYKIVTSTINQKDAGGDSETIGALEKITITGFVADAFGNKKDGFNGEIIPTVYDKELVMETLGNGGENPVSFKVRENIIYKGKASVQNGNFTFSFVAPKDISYSLGKGKIMYYAQNGDEDAHGAFDNFNIGGSGSSIVDNQGPQIELFLDSPSFKSGDITSKNPTLLANLSDENGINTVGTGIGHDITAVIDDDYSNVMVLNNYYQANTDDYTRGVIEFPLQDLSVGKHTLRLKAWDVANNSSEAEIEFEVTSDFVVTGIRNYPNPVSDHTYFVLDHNQAGASFDVIFDIYDQYGRSVDRFQTQVSSNGSSTNPIRWDMKESNIVATAGIYIYRVLVKNEEGLICSKSGKMLIAR